jgi:hypothetical protein
VLANRLSDHIPFVRPGSSIKASMASVFEEQRNLFTGRNGRDSATATPTDATAARKFGQSVSLSPADARILTNTIRSQFDRCWLLLFEAHERRVWKALGYKSWTAYVRQELELSRSRSYELLAYCRVVHALMSAASTCTVPRISPYAASQIKPVVGQLSEEIRARIARQAGDNERVAIVEAAVRERRGNLTATKSLKLRSDGAKDAHVERAARVIGRFDPDFLYETIDYLAALPDPEVLLDAPSDLDPDRMVALRRAIKWLLRFEFERSRRHQKFVAGSSPRLETAIA